MKSLCVGFGGASVVVAFYAGFFWLVDLSHDQFGMAGVLGAVLVFMGVCFSVLHFIGSKRK